MYMNIHDTHMYTHIYIYSTYITIKYNAGKIFMTRSYIFNIKTIIFMIE